MAADHDILIANDRDSGDSLDRLVGCDTQGRDMLAAWQRGRADATPTFPALRTQRPS